MRLQMCCPFTVTWQSQILMLGCSFVTLMCFFWWFLWDRWINLKLSLVSEILFKSVSDFEQVKPFERPLWEPEQDYLTSSTIRAVTEIKYQLTDCHVTWDGRIRPKFSECGILFKMSWLCWELIEGVQRAEDAALSRLI